MGKAVNALSRFSSFSPLSLIALKTSRRRSLVQSQFAFKVVRFHERGVVFVVVVVVVFCLGEVGDRVWLVFVDVVVFCLGEEGDRVSLDCM